MRRRTIILCAILSCLLLFLSTGTAFANEPDYDALYIEFHVKDDYGNLVTQVSAQKGGELQPQLDAVIYFDNGGPDPVFIENTEFYYLKESNWIKLEIQDGKVMAPEEAGTFSLKVCGTFSYPGSYQLDSYSSSYLDKPYVLQLEVTGDAQPSVDVDPADILAKNNAGSSYASIGQDSWFNDDVSLAVDPASPNKTTYDQYILQYAVKDAQNGYVGAEWYPFSQSVANPHKALNGHGAITVGFRLHDGTVSVSEEPYGETTLQFDNSAPAASFTINGSPIEDIWYGDIELQVTLSDLGSGIDANTVKYKEDGQNETVPTQIIDGKFTIIPQQQSRQIEIEVFAADLAGNALPATKQTLKIDKQSPGIPAISGDGYSSGSWTDSQVTLTALSSAGASGIAEYKWYKKDGITGQFTIPLTGSGEKKATLIIPAADGEEAYAATAVTNTGIESSLSDAYFVKMDTTAPNAPTLAAENGYDGSWTNSSVTLRAMAPATLPLSGIKDYVWEKHVATTDTWEAVAGETSDTLTVSENTDTKYRVRVRANTGLASDPSEEVNAKIDSTTPVVELTCNPADGLNDWHTNDIPVTITISDAFGSIDTNTLVCEVNGNAQPLTPVIEGKRYSLTIDESMITATGMAAITIDVSDMAGNAATQRQKTIKLDKGEPGTLSIISILSNGLPYEQGQESEHPVTASLAAANDSMPSGITYQYKVGGGNYQNLTGNILTISESSQSAVQYTLRAVTGAGKVSSEVTVAIWYQSGKPEQPVIQAKTTAGAYNSTWTNKDITITIDPAGSTLAAKYQYSKNMGSWKDITGDRFVISEDGEASYRFRAISAVGKASDESPTFVTRIDKTIPVIKSYTPAAKAALVVGANKVTVTMSERVQGTPVVTSNWGKVQNVTLAKDGMRLSFMFTPDAYNSSYTLAISGLSDKAGNTMKKSTITYKSEKEPAPAIALTGQPGWKKTDAGEWIYYDSNGALAQNRWVKNSGAWYYMDTQGKMQTGWFRDSTGKKYYADASGKMQTGWLRLKGQWYYLQPSGAMQTGWLYVGSKWYYLEAVNGVMQTSWFTDKTGTWYYANTSGAMQTGWLESGAHWYYLKDSGAMAEAQWQYVNGSWYYFSNSGAMQTGWLQLGSGWYYLRPLGSMASGVQQIGGRTYTFQSSGEWVE